MIKGILFDKDGTLIEFSSAWVDSTYKLIDTVVTEFTKEDQLRKSQEIARMIGLDGDRVVPDSILAAKTSGDIAAVMANVLQADKDSIHKKIKHIYYENAVKESASIKPIGNLVSLFERLRKRNIRIGIVTADNYDATQFTIEKLGIGEYIDFIATADLYKEKPHAEAMQVFCNKFSLQMDEVIHVGDSRVDMEFSKHGLFGVGVLSGVGSEETLRKHTSHIINSVQSLFDQNNNFLFEKI